MSLSKADLISKIKALGEDPPESWTKVELLARYNEMTASTSKRRAKTDLQEQIRRLNAASRKKSELEQFCKDLGLSTPSRATMAEMQSAALDQIYTVTPPNGLDHVGFGPWAKLTYVQLLQKPDFCAQILTEAKNPEGRASPRLKRLAAWLKDNMSLDSEKELPGKTPWVPHEKTSAVGEQLLLDAISTLEELYMTMKSDESGDNDSWTAVSVPYDG